MADYASAKVRAMEFLTNILPWPQYAEFFISLIAMLNPIGAVPMFLMFTASETLEQRKDTARLAALTCCGVLLVALFVGDLILQTFGVTIPAFRTGGGLLILLTALANLQAQQGAMKQTAEEAEEGVHKASVAVVPLGIPLLAGPGSISAVILYTANHPRNLTHYAVLCLGIVLCAFTCWIAFRAAPWLARALGRTGINVFTRIMGLIMVAVGVQFLAVGLKALFPGLR
jgi:multiple antibiotic resistance protein